MENADIFSCLNVQKHLLMGYINYSFARRCSKQVFRFIWLSVSPGLEVIKLEFNLKLKINRPQAANHCVFLV